MTAATRTSARNLERPGRSDPFGQRPCARGAFFALAAAFAAGCLLTATGCEPEASLENQAGQAQRLAPEPIRPLTANPRYWKYDGTPTLLIGGSREDNLFQIQDLEAHLDLLASAGGNYIRNTMSSRDSGNVWPFLRMEDGRYDLERLSESYYGRFADLLTLAEERRIVVQIEVWDRFDFAREAWLENPYRPANNITYTPEASGLANAYPRHPGENDNPFFRSVPALDNNQVLLRFQHAQVDRLLEIALQHGNVLYTMDNETNGSAEWGAYWARYIKDRAAVLGKTVYVTEMWDAWDLKDPQHRRTLDFPELYGFVDVSQNNHNTGQVHWDNLQWVRDYTADLPRPLNNVKIYGAEASQFGTERDAEERFWRNLIGGAASMRFHRPPSGLGLSATPMPHLRSARLLLAVFDVIQAVPDARSDRLKDRDDNEAYLSSLGDDRFAIYFPDGGSVKVDLTDVTGNFTVRWLDVHLAAWDGESTVTGGALVDLTSPGPGHWVAVLTR